MSLASDVGKQVGNSLRSIIHFNLKIQSHRRLSFNISSSYSQWLQNVARDKSEELPGFTRADCIDLKDLVARNECHYYFMKFGHKHDNTTLLVLFVQLRNIN